MGRERNHIQKTPLVNEEVKKVEEEIIKEQPVEEIKEQVEEEIKEQEAETEEVEAVIDGVENYLNIRRKPEVKANNQIAILSKGTKIIVVDPKKPVKNKDGEWFRIRLFGKDKDDEDNNGFAMKKYIKII